MKFSALYFAAAMAGLVVSAPAPSPEAKEIIDPSQQTGFANLEPVFIGDIPSDVSSVSPLQKRSGYHYAQYYSGSSCQGSIVATYENFGCGGACNGFPGALSVFIFQAGTSNPRPSASNFFASGCNSASGGYNIPLQNANGACYTFPQTVHSSYLYWDC